MELSQNFVISGSSGEITTNFLYPVRLEDGFELALSYFFCGPLCNVNNERDLLYLVKGDGHGIVVQEKLLQIPHGYYHTTGDSLNTICQAINKFIRENTEIWGSATARVDYNIQRRIWTLILPKKQNISIAHDKCWTRNVLNLFTGLEDGNYTELAVVESEFTESRENIFIYSSIVQESNINDHQTRLLAVLPVRVNARYTHYEPLTLKFYKIAIEDFSSISFEIRNERGNLVDFDRKESCENNNVSDVLNGFSLADGMYGEKTIDNHIIIGLMLKKK